MSDRPTIVVTGGAGFVGRYLLAALREAWPTAQLVVWDRTVDGLPGGTLGEQVDITEPKDYLASLGTLRPDWIIHLAAISAVGASLQEPALTHRINVEATQRLLEAVQTESPATRLLVTSTADIYGQGSATPLPELPLAAAQPQSPYSRSKWEMEQCIERAFADRVIRVRPFPHIGPAQPLGFVTADFAAQVAAIERGEQEPVMQVGNLEAQRDFTDVRDVVRAYVLLLQRGVVGEVYHVASGVAVSIQSILDQLLAQATVSIEVVVDPTRLRPSDIPVLVGDATKLRQATGWKPTIPLSRTLADVLAWWRDATLG